MKKKILSALIFSFFSLSQAQVFEVEKNDSLNKNIQTQNNQSQNQSDDDDIIIDKSKDEVIIEAKPIASVDKWMSTVQAKERNYSQIEEMLKNGQNANQGIFEGSSMLHLAAWQNDEKLFSLGMSYGGNLSILNKNGETPLHWAAYSKNPNIIKMALSDKNALKLINKTNKNGRNVFHFNALQWGNIDVAKILISAKADINIKDNNGQTPLHYAVALRRWDLAKLYIMSGADTKIKDNSGDAFDEYLMRNGDIEGYKLLYSYLSPENQSIIKNRLSPLTVLP